MSDFCIECGGPVGTEDQEEFDENGEAVYVSAECMFDGAEE